MTEFKTIDELRIARNEQLQKTDYMLLPDHNLSEVGRALLLTYRQQLRDLTLVYDETNVSDAVIPPLPPKHTLYQVE